VHRARSRVPPVALDAFGLLLRLGLAAVWFSAGIPKIADLAQNYGAVQAYELLPPSAVGIVSIAQLFLEVALGVLILVGIGTRLVSGLSLLLLALYIAGIASVWARGLSIDCGCFTAGGAVAQGNTHYAVDIARDVGFALMALWLLVRPYSIVSADGLLNPPEGRSEESEEHEEPSPHSAATPGGW
jgi:uncharacterized membrane protein YphA (DoxX/SURF4 family)